MKDATKALKLNIVLKGLEIKDEAAIGIVIGEFFRVHQTENTQAYEQ